MRILTTLSRPDEGRATVAGIDVLARPGKVRSVIGAVSQHSGAIGLLTGQENLAMQGRLYGLGGRDLSRRVTQLLEAFGLTEAANRQARTYSGGMRRRLDIATVLGTGRRCCSWTSPPPALTRRVARICGRC